MLDGVLPGTATFEWLPGERFLLWRTHMEHEQVPDGLFVIGPTEDGDGLAGEYFDSRGVRRTYQCAVDAGEWRMWRDEPGFRQRFTVRIDPQRFEMVTELARDDEAFERDLVAVYSR